MSREMEQENIENTPSSVEESGVILQETSPPVGEQEGLKETLQSGSPQEVLEKIPPSVEEQEVPKETSPSVDEQEVPKEIPTTEEQQVSKEPVPSEIEQEVLLKESEIKKEPDDIQEKDFCYMDDDSTIVTISDDDDEELDKTSVPLSLPIELSTLQPSSYAISALLATEHSGNVNKLYHHAPKRYSVKKPKRRCSSVPRYVKLLTEPGKTNYAITDSESDDDNDFALEFKLPTLKPSLKRKRSLIIPDNFEFENTRKTMKPGPKSKTRNIATVRDMINEAKRLGLGPSMRFSDSSDEEMSVDSDDSSDEREFNTIEFIDLVTSSDDEADDIKPGTVECVIDNNEISEKDANENSINDENKSIDNTASETLNDKTNETENVTELLENAIDSNKMKEDENTENKELKYKEINPNQILDDKNYNDEVEEKNSLNDTIEQMDTNGVGE